MEIKYKFKDKNTEANGAYCRSKTKAEKKIIINIAQCLDTPP